MKQAVVITGAAGFLGSHLAEFYLKKNFVVIGIDNLSTGSKENVTFLKKFPLFHFFEQDACESWQNVISDVQKNNFKFHYVFHFASPASPPLYQKLALETMWVNSTGLQQALHFADQHKARVVFASTSEVYGDPALSPQPESYWGNVNSYGERSCYDEAKRFGEALIFSHNKQLGTSHGLVRIFNTYGPRMNPNDGRVVINFIVQALNNKKLTIYGDGKQTRSFCYVGDLIEGIHRYAESGVKFPINLGNDTEFTISELAEIVLKMTASKSSIEHLALPADDPKKRRPDLSMARRHLNEWKPVVKLQDGIAEMIAWVKSL